MNRAGNPYNYVADPTKGRPLFNADLYFGIPDLDPEIPANQISVSVQQEDGTIVPVAQPIQTGAGGVPMYDGSPAIILINEHIYSFKALDRFGAQIYYQENASAVLDPSTVVGVQDTYADVRALTASYPFETIIVGGHSVVDDGGGGTFVYDSSDASSSDNGGTILVDTDGRRWKRVFDGGLSVLWFGAVRDGATDNASAFSSAIAFAASIGASVYIPSGTYRIASNVSILAGLKIFGDGRNSVIFCDGCWFGADGAFVGAAVDHFKISDLTFISPDNYTGQTFRLAGDASFNDIYRFEIDNVLIRKVSLNPAPASDNFGTAFYASGAYGGVVTNLIVFDYENAVVVENVPTRETGLNAVVFNGGEAQSCHTALNFYAARNISVNNFIMQGCQGVGAHIAGSCQGITFRDTYTEANIGGDFLIDSVLAGNEPNINVNFENIVVRASSSSPSYSLEVSNCSGLNIDGYSVRGGNVYGTSLIGNTAATASQVIGNFRNVMDGFINQYAIEPINTENPSGGSTPAINLETIYFHNYDRSFYARDQSSVTNSASTPTVLRAYSVPANNVTTRGAIWRYTVRGSFGATANTKTVTVNIGGVTIKNFTTSIATAEPWSIEIEVVPSAVASSSQRVFIKFHAGDYVDTHEAATAISQASSYDIEVVGDCIDATITAKNSFANVVR